MKNETTNNSYDITVNNVQSVIGGEHVGGFLGLGDVAAVAQVSNEDDINIAFKELFIKNMNKIFVVAQTTFSLEKFNEFTENIRKRVQEDRREADSFKIDKSNKYQNEKYKK